MTISTLKKCSKCGEHKTRGEFYVNNSYCKLCDKLQLSEWIKNNPEKAKIIQEKWRKNNPEKIKVRKKNWRKNNPEKVKVAVESWRKNNPEKVKVAAENWRKNNLEKYYMNDARHYLKQKFKMNPPQEIVEIKLLQLQLFRIIKEKSNE